MPASPICAEDVAREGLLSDRVATYRSEGICSMMALPIFVQEQRRGTLVFYFRSSHSFSKHEIRSGETLARLSSSALAASELYREQSLAKVALETSERNFRAVSETAACAIFIHNGAQVVYRNRAAAELVGMEPGETSAMWERVHPHDREMVKARAVARLRGEDPPSRYEFRIQRPDGAVVWLDLTATAVEYGGTKCILATAFDVTERRFAVEQMRRREQEARTLLDNLPDVISRFDRNLRHLYVSPHVERLTGIPVSASLGKTFEEIGYPAHLCELWNDSLRRVFAEGTAHSVEFSYQGPDGQTRHFIATGVPEITRDGVVESVVTFSRDITEQRNTVQQLKASQTQLRLIIDSVPGLVAYVDTEERLRRVNRTFEEWFQRPLKNILGLTIGEITGENYAHLAPRVSQALAGQEVQFEARNRYPDASRDVLITYVPDIDDNGEVCGFVALVLDVTERRKSEDAMRRTEKLAAAGRLAASIAHEINNPLESVTNLIYLLNQDPSLSSASREYLTLAEQELTRVSQIATQTLRFHRQSSRAVSLRVRELLDALCTLYRARFDRLGIVLERRYRDGDTITAFEGELRQLFANLIANALDAMPGGGRLLLRTRTAVRADGVRGIQVTVADTGQGITDELRGRIFEPFVTSKGMTGTGLGLWVSKEIVQKHKGSIRVRSRSNGAWRGTVFVVFLAETPVRTTNESSTEV
jgi:PAS domain S-box-containing protein